jgi:N-acetylmuramoyl-L-alanine amidase
MKIKVGIVVLAIALLTIFLANLLAFPARSQKPTQINLVYPADGAKTESDRIFFIGNVPGNGTLFLNGRSVKRSKSGNFAPSLPLNLGGNQIALSYRNNRQEIIDRLQLKVRRLVALSPPTDVGFLADSLFPNVNITKPLAEKICFKAIATPKSEVSVKVGEKSIPLTELENNFLLPENSAVLTGKNQPISLNSQGNYQGCDSFSASLDSVPVIYTISQNSKNQTQTAKGKIAIQEINQLAEVIVDSAIARTGAGSDFSRLTPLPKGTQAQVTATEGDWLRLDYGGWVENKSVKLRNSNLSARSLVRSLSTRVVSDRGEWTEIIFPLQVPVPISISQSDDLFRLTLHNVTAQTDTILANADGILKRLTWQQIEPGKIQYGILLKSKQQWGYKVRYQGTSLILSLRHPSKPKNIKILLDPGHGSAADLGSRGGTGYPEKDVTLILAKLLGSELKKYGAEVIFTRTADEDILPGARAEMIEQIQPTLALSLHYNALPDSGDPENTQGIGMFWYHAQSQPLAQFLHDYLVSKLDRKSYGVFWNNLALARPTVAPAILLELGFMTHPQEFEWITDAIAQKQLAKTLATGIYTWLEQS